MKKYSHLTTYLVLLTSFILLVAYALFRKVYATFTVAPLLFYFFPKSSAKKEAENQENTQKQVKWPGVLLLTVFNYKSTEFYADLSRLEFEKITFDP